MHDFDLFLEKESIIATSKSRAAQLIEKLIRITITGETINVKIVNMLMCP